MSFNRMAEEFQHGFEAKAFSVNDPSPSLGLADKVPQQIDLEVDQKKRECNKEESGHRVLGGRANAAVILESVAGFNAEAVFVVVM